MQKPEYIIEHGVRNYYDENEYYYKSEPFIRRYIVKYPGEEKTAFEHWFSNLVFKDEYTTRDLQEAYMQGYNQKELEMKDTGLALQSDMDKTIEQNMTLKKENAELKKKYVKNICDCDICDTYCNSQLTYAKTIIQDLLENTDEYARQRAEDFLKE